MCPSSSAEGLRPGRPLIAFAAVGRKRSGAAPGITGSDTFMDQDVVLHGYTATPRRAQHREADSVYRNDVQELVCAFADILNCHPVFAVSSIRGLVIRIG